MKSKGVNIVCLLLIVIAFVGCRPRTVLSNREMRDVLYDLHRVDGAMQIAGYNYGHNQELASYYKSVLDKHGITQAQFDSSLVWFTDNPQIFNKIYPQVIERLEADMEREDQLRDERLERNRSDKKGTNQIEIEEHINTLRPWEEVQNEYLHGIENPWKEWAPKEFCEKNVIIFGQLEKK